MLEQDGVTQNKVGASEAGNLVVGEVPGHDAQEHTERRTADEGFAFTFELGDGFVGEELLAVGGLARADVCGEADFTESLLERLAHLANDGFCQHLSTVAVELSNLLDQY